MSYKVKEVADIVGISIRTLHYYDEIGLLKPESIGENNYRFYDDNKLERLQQILFFKELDFSLEDIKNILDNPYFDRRIALESHKKLLLKKKERLEKIIKTVEKTIICINGENKMGTEEMFKGFDMKEIDEHKQKYTEEVKQRWGNTDAYKESNSKTSKYNKDDWQRISNEQSLIYKKFVDNMDKGFADSKVQEAVQEWKNNLSKNFYNCTDEILKGLGDMYVNDERFTKNIDKHKEGLSVFLRDAFHYYCNNKIEKFEGE